MIAYGSGNSRRQRPQPRRPADPAGRQRRRHDQDRPAHRYPQGDAAEQPVAVDARPHGRQGRTAGRQHRPAGRADVIKRGAGMTHLVGGSFCPCPPTGGGVAERPQGHRSGTVRYERVPLCCLPATGQGIRAYPTASFRHRLAGLRHRADATRTNRGRLLERIFRRCRPGTANTPRHSWLGFGSHTRPCSRGSPATGDDPSL